MGGIFHFGKLPALAFSGLASLGTPLRESGSFIRRSPVAEQPPTTCALKKIIAFLFGFLILLTVGLVAFKSYPLPVWVTAPWRLGLQCAVVGGIGGCLYCLRAVYLNACVHKRWDPAWELWYYLRPTVSVLCGAVSCLFLKAGLLLLEASRPANTSNLGFYAFAFVAGLNVDNFVAKIEDIAKATWGIEKSRATALSREPESKPNQ